jgi:hypothetical protein
MVAEPRSRGRIEGAVRDDRVTRLRRTRAKRRDFPPRRSSTQRTSPRSLISARVIGGAIPLEGRRSRLPSE